MVLNLLQLLHCLFQMLNFTLQGVGLLSSGSDLLLHVHGHLEA